MIYSCKIDKNSGVPIYVQISEHIHMCIKNGYFVEGDKLPGQRVLAKRLGVGRNTIILALDKLAREEVVAVHPKSGVFIAGQRGNRPDWGAYIKRANYRQGVSEYKFWRDKEALRDFSISTDFDMSDYFKDAIIKSSERVRELQFNPAHGLEALRESVVSYMAEHQVYIDVSNVIIFPSVDLTIYTLCAALMSSGSTLLHEKITLLNTISNIHSLGLNIEPVNQDRFGMDADYLEQMLATRKHSVVFADPIASSPAGVTMTKTRQKEMLKVLSRYGVPLIEQGHKRDMWCDKPYPSPIKALPGSDNVIYLGSFPKGPIRMGITWVVADRVLVEHLSNVIVQLASAPNMISQIITDEMFRSGMYGRMMADVRAFICRRRQAALQMCGHYLKGIAEWDEERCGFYFWIRLTEKINRQRLYEALNFFPGYFFEKNNKEHVLLCPPSLPEHALEETVRSIAGLVN